MELNDAFKRLYIETAKQLKGSYRRLYMARVVGAFGYGGQSLAQRELGWNRDTIRKAEANSNPGNRSKIISRHEAANRLNTICPIYCKTSRRSSVGRARPILRSRASASTPV